MQILSKFSPTRKVVSVRPDDHKHYQSDNQSDINTKFYKRMYWKYFNITLHYYYIAHKVIVLQVTHIQEKCEQTELTGNQEIRGPPQTTPRKRLEYHRCISSVPIFYQKKCNEVERVSIFIFPFPLSTFVRMFYKSVCTRHANQNHAITHQRLKSTGSTAGAASWSTAPTAPVVRNQLAK